MDNFFPTNIQAISQDCAALGINAEYMNQIHSYNKTLIYPPVLFLKILKNKSLKSCCQEVLETHDKKQNSTSNQLGKVKVLSQCDDI